MRAVIAMMKHETNTFSPVPTPLARFGRDGAWFGNSAAAAFRGTNTGMAAFLDLCHRAGAQIATPVAASASPSGVVPDAVYRRLSDAICEAVDRGCDALFLDLHGAMVAEGTDDGEGTLLARIRALRPDLPIAVALDLHTNLTEAMVANATVLAGYKTYPHIDIYRTGERAGKLLLRSLAGEIMPVMEWRRLPVLAHTLKMGTDDQPMRDLIASAESFELEGLLDVSVFGGFPMADIPQPGFSVLAVADRDRGGVRRAVGTPAEAAWQRRREFVYRSEPLAQSIARAKAMTAAATGNRPILLIDHADNCASGGTQDTMAVLAEALRQGLTDMAVFAICDPWAIETLIKAGIGATVTLPLGGKLDMPAIGRKGEPLILTGRVRIATDGEFTVTGPMMTGTRASLGRSVVFESAGVSIVVCERNHEPWDLGCFRSLGIEPTEKRYLLLKSRIHYRAGFLPIAGAIVECDGVGVTSSNYALFPFRKIERPVYPLDAMA
jgi:microcystin degradation protein MlrC